MLSDKGSKVIREFGILNTNIPLDHPFYGVPFPGEYLIAPGGVIRSKFFLPEYNTRVASSEILMQESGSAPNAASMVLKSGELRVTIAISANHAAPGQEIGLRADFMLAPGWHVYGSPLPVTYKSTTLAFDESTIAKSVIEFPRAEKVTFESLNETLPVYTGSFAAKGALLLKSQLKPGEQQIKGVLGFQECNDSICKIPQTVNFEIPFRIDPLAAPAKESR
jgi:hypothetical protein